MDRAVRFSLFALGAFIGALFVTFALESTNEPTEEPGLARRLSDRVGEQLILRSTPNLGRGESDEGDDIEEMAAQGRRAGQRRAALINELAAQEAVDPGWAPAMERRMTAQFAAHAPEGATLVSATCKTSLCIAEVESLSSRDSTGQLGWSAMFGIRRGFVMNEETAIEGQYRSVVYMSRDGHSLPK
jgi:hypothetical protein